jgi:hypothetical protein
LLLANNALQECHCGRIDPTSYLTKLTKDNRKQNHDGSKVAETKTTTRNDINEHNKERKLNSEGINQSTVGIEKNHKN